MAEGSKTPRTNMLLFGSVVFVVTVFVLLLISQGPRPASGNSNAVPPAPTTEAAPSSNSTTEPEAPTSAWTYTDTTAGIENRPSHEACVTSSNHVIMRYFGETTADLCLRSGRYNDATIQFSDNRGQFVCGIEGCSIKARFDDGPVQRFGASDEATDGTDYTLFLSDRGRLASDILRAKEAVFEITLFDSGEQELEFPVAGLKWGAQAAKSLHHGAHHGDAES